VGKASLLVRTIKHSTLIRVSPTTQSAAQLAVKHDATSGPAEDLVVGPTGVHVRCTTQSARSVARIQWFLSSPVVIARFTAAIASANSARMPGEAGTRRNIGRRIRLPQHTANVARL